MEDERGYFKSTATSKDKEQKRDDITPIRHVFQYGPPRTASTTQFNILCVALFLHTRIYSPELANNTICTLAGSMTHEEAAYKFTLQQDDIPQAVKSHVKVPDPLQIHNSTIVFGTATNAKQAEQRRAQMKRLGLNIGILQDLQSLRSSGIDSWLKIYVKFFRLSPTEYKLMLDYFSIWETLRQCCGMQMSKLYRNELLSPAQRDKEMTKHKFCGSIDINSLETKFMNTELYHIMNNYEAMRRINRPATVDGDLDGTYCSRYNDAIRFNGIPPGNQKIFGLNSRYKEVEDHFREEMSNPFGRIEHLIDRSCEDETYIFYTAFNGFTNQLFDIERVMRIAYSTNRTIILPPLLPHKGENPYGAFIGRDYGKQAFTLEQLNWEVHRSLVDVANVRMLSNRTHFPSWSEVLNFDFLTRRTGVRVIDLYDFVKNNKICLHEFMRQPLSPVPIIKLTEESTNWKEFIASFVKIYEENRIAVIGSVTALDLPNTTFTSHKLMFEKHDRDNHKLINTAIRSLALSTRILNLTKAAFVYRPSTYVAIHLRTGDGADERIQSCKDRAIVKEYNRIIKSLSRINVKYGSTIYVASNDSRAKECFNEISQNKYDVIGLDDILLEALSTPGSNMQELLHRLLIDPGTKHLLLDLFLVSMAAEVYFAKIDFKPRASTLQALIKVLHSERDERLHELEGS